jgi:multidrug efflux pump
MLVRAPRAFGNRRDLQYRHRHQRPQRLGAATLGLGNHGRRRHVSKDLPGVRAFPVMRQGFGSRIQKPVQFVIGGGTYEQLAQWRDILVEQINANNPGLVGLDWDYKETKPQLRVVIDYDRAAELGVSIGDIGRTLETVLGSRKVTTYIDAGEEYDVILKGERAARSAPRPVWRTSTSARRARRH